MTTRLPEKPSDLILLALEDLSKAEKSDAYDVVMSQWHHPCDSDGVCEVCLAGSVMAFSLDADVDDDLSPASLYLNPQDHRRLVALDDFRKGDTAKAFRTLGMEPPVGFRREINVPPYYVDPAGFKKTLKAFAKRLYRAGY